MPRNILATSKLPSIGIRASQDLSRKAQRFRQETVGEKPHPFHNLKVWRRKSILLQLGKKRPTFNPQPPPPTPSPLILSKRPREKTHLYLHPRPLSTAPTTRLGTSGSATPHYREQLRLRKGCRITTKKKMRFSVHELHWTIPFDTLPVWPRLPYFLSRYLCFSLLCDFCKTASSLVLRLPLRSPSVWTRTTWTNGTLYLCPHGTEEARKLPQHSFVSRPQTCQIYSDVSLLK